ncbi:MAG: hypothetical protein ACHQYP_10310 [Nitrospiria bacterium]
MKISQRLSLKNIPEVLKPFGLILGHSSEKDVNELIRRENGKIISCDLFDLHTKETVNRNHKWLAVSGLNHFFLFSAVYFEFYKNTLFGLCCIFPPGQSPDKFEEIFNALDLNYYGPATRYNYNSNIEDTFAIWKCGGITIELLFGWEKKELYLIYTSDTYVRRVKDENDKYFREMVMEK